MKFGPVTKLDKRNETMLKKIDHDIESKNCSVIAFFEFTVNLDQSISRIPDP